MLAVSLALGCSARSWPTPDDVAVLVLSQLGGAPGVPGLRGGGVRAPLPAGEAVVAEVAGVGNALGLIGF